MINVNKNGFTLVELLAVIVIISLLAGIATVSYASLINQSNNKAFETYEDTMHAEAVYKLTMHFDDVTFTNGKATLYLSDLGIDPINNPINPNDKCVNSYVEVTKSHVNSVLSMHYKVCLICNDYNNDGTKCRDYEN